MENSRPLILEISSDEEAGFGDLRKGNGYGVGGGEFGDGEDCNWLTKLFDEVGCGNKIDDDSDYVVVVSEVFPKTPKKSRSESLKPSAEAVVVDDGGGDDDDCVVLDGDPDKAVVVVNSKFDDDSDSDNLKIVGEKGKVLMENLSPLILEISSDDEADFSYSRKGSGYGVDGGEFGDGEDYNWLTKLFDEVGCGNNIDDDSDDVVVVSEVFPKTPKKSRSESLKPLAEAVVVDDGGGGDDDCVVLDGDPDKAVIVVKCKVDDDSDSDDLKIVGEKGKVLMENLSPLIWEISSDEEAGFGDSRKGSGYGVGGGEFGDGEDCNWLTKLLDEVDCGNNIDDDFDDVVVVSEVFPKTPKKSRLQSLKPSAAAVVVDDGGGGDDDCVVLDGDPDKAVVVVNNKVDDDSDSDDLKIVGEKGEVACRDFPHARHFCAKFIFASTPHEVHCGQCHCYVCDSLAPCPHWGTGISSIDHCHASDKEEYWKAERKRVKKGDKPVPVNSTTSSTSRLEAYFPTSQVPALSGQQPRAETCEER